MNTEHVNKGDTAYPRNNYVDPEYRENPALLQSEIAKLGRQIALTIEDIQALKSILRNKEVEGEEADEIRFRLSIAKRTHNLLNEVQANGKHKMRVMKRERRSAGPIKNY